MQTALHCCAACIGAQGGAIVADLRGEGADQAWQARAHLLGEHRVPGLVVEHLNEALKDQLGFG